ncbi:MAG: hydantoinase/oxoprolinase family protein [Bilophila wadsworthia]
MSKNGKPRPCSGWIWAERIPTPCCCAAERCSRPSVPTNHQDLLVSTREALHALFESGAAFPADVSRATFGTTLAVNAVVQNACAPVGLLIGAGPGLDPGWFGLGGHAALVPGGVDHRGTEVAPPDREAIRRVVSGWREEGLAAFACVAKFSTRNPAHEDAMAEVIREVFSDGPEPVIALGHRLSGRLNFPRRIATAYWNAAVWTLHNRFADAVEASLKDMGIDAPAYLLKADGGAIPLSVSRERPVEALLSGPAASVMGMMALMPSCSEDTLVLDMGGTTTDIALLAAGQPVLSPDDLVVNGRSTLVRALKSVSIGLGGDSQVTVAPGIQVGPLRKGPALAFGGTDGPTFLDCLNVLGHADAGDVAASRAGVESLAAAHGLSAESLSQEVLDCARSRVASAVRSLLDEVNSRPVYTLAALLEERAVRPARAVLVGGPAEAVAPLLGDALGLPVETLGDPVLGPVANAIGAALTRPRRALICLRIRRLVCCWFRASTSASPLHGATRSKSQGRGVCASPWTGRLCLRVSRNRRHRGPAFRHARRVRARRRTSASAASFGPASNGRG